MFHPESFIAIILIQTSKYLDMSNHKSVLKLITAKGFFKNYEHACITSLLKIYQ